MLALGGDQDRITPPSGKIESRRHNRANRKNNTRITRQSQRQTAIQQQAPRRSE
jgi:hypothetical protein